MEHRYDGLEAQSFKIVMWGLAALCFLLLVTPTLVVIVVSFTSGFSLKFPPPGYSLRWYVALLDAWQLHFAASNSLKVAIWTTAALGRARRRRRARHRALREMERARARSACSCRRWCCRRSPSGSRR